MALIKPVRPIIDWGNSLTNGLVFDAPLFEGAGVKPIALIGTIGSPSFNSTPTWTKKLYGTALDNGAADSSNATIYTTADYANNVHKVTYEMLLYPRGYGSSDNRLFQKGAPSGYWGSIQLSPSITKLDFSYTLNGGVNFAEWSCPITLNQWNHVVLTYDDSSSSNNAIIYINGVSITVTTITAPSGTRDADGTTFVIGNRGVTPYDRGLNGIVAYARYWNRVLTLGEARSLYQNPWRIYKKSKMVFSFSSYIKTALGLSKASVKTVNGLAIASVKNMNGLT